MASPTVPVPTRQTVPVTESSAVRVLVVDDSRPFRIAASGVLRRAEGFTIVGEAEPQTVVFLCSTYDLADLPAQVGVGGVAAYVHKEELRPELLEQLWREHA